MENQHTKSFDLKGMVIPCPLVGFALRKAERCFECEHHLGIQKPSEEIMVICGKPITRRIQRVVEE